MQFIREIALEGFIPDRFLWSSGLDASGPGLRWVVDSSWLSPDPQAFKNTRRFMIRLLIGAFAFWLGLLATMVIK